MQCTGTIKDISMDFKTKLPQVTLLLNEKGTLEQVEMLKELKKLSVEIKKYRQKRSLDANAYFHVLVNKLARHFGVSDTEMKTKMNLEYGTVALNLDGTKVGVKVPYGTDIKQFYPYCKKFGECEENGINFEKYLFYKETHTLDSKEMAELIDGVIQECKEAGIETMTPAELKRLKEAWDERLGRNGIS